MDRMCSPEGIFGILLCCFNKSNDALNRSTSHSAYLTNKLQNLQVILLHVSRQLSSCRTYASFQAL